MAGNQHWGHATSEDLYHWTNQPIAIYAVNESSYIFTGSAVVDRNNTSGFFPNQNNGVVAIFTIATYEPVSLESQGLAYSYDGGYTFEMYEGNPVLDVGSDQFRDPKVFWYNDHWVMAVAYAQEFVIGIFTSQDLKAWTHASNFSHHGLLGLQYECPNLVEVPVEDSDDTMFLLQISINPGSIQGGSSSEYFLGDFDGYTFTPMDNVTRNTDFSKDAYAGQFFDNLPRGQAVSINWASNWEYVQQSPTGELEGWRSTMAIPRSISIRQIERIGWTEIARPYDISPVVGETLAQHSMGNGSFAVDYAGVQSNAVWLSCNITNLPPRANITGGTVNFTFTSPVSMSVPHNPYPTNKKQITGEYLRSGYYLSNDNYFFVDRGGTRGFDNVFFTDKFAANVLPNGSFQFDAIIDRSIFETFLNDGSASSTTSFFPTSPLTLMSFAANGIPAGTTVDATVYALNSAWQQYEDANGTVLGNVSMSGAMRMKERRHPRMLYETDFP